MFSPIRRAITAPPPSGATAIYKGMVSRWSFSNGANLGQDSWDNNDLTNTNGVTQADGPFDKAAQFVRASARYLTVPDNAKVSTGDIDFTIITWVYLDSKPTQAGIVSKGAGGTGALEEYGIEYIASTDRFRFYVSNGGTAKILTASTFGAPSLSTWIFLAAYHDSVNDRIGLTVNNAINTTSHALGVQDAAGAFEIGREFNSNSFCFDGKIGPVYFLKRVVLYPELMTLYNNGAPVGL